MKDGDLDMRPVDYEKHAMHGAVIGVVAAFVFVFLLGLTALLGGNPVRPGQWLTILVVAPVLWLLLHWWIPASVGFLLGLALARNARKHAGRAATLRTLGLGAAAPSSPGFGRVAQVRCRARVRARKKN